VVVFVNLSEAGGVDAGVDLGGVDVGMAEEFLYDSEVRAAGEEVRGEAVPEDMGVDIFEPGGCCGGFDDAPDGDAVEWPAGA